jgi:hypothetical protein
MIEVSEANSIQKVDFPVSYLPRALGQGCSIHCDHNSSGKFQLIAVIARGQVPEPQTLVHRIGLFRPQGGRRPSADMESGHFR